MQLMSHEEEEEGCSSCLDLFITQACLAPRLVLLITSKVYCSFPAMCGDSAVARDAAAGSGPPDCRSRLLAAARRPCVVQFTAN